jgi:Protein of unknown function (DUF1566)
MQLSTAFSDWTIDSSDTATDRTNGLMWMRHPVMRSDEAYNEPLLLDWHSAVTRFGRGVQAGGSAELGRAELIRKVAPLTRRENGYTTPKTPTVFAGYSNWRLPTVQEVVTITFDEVWGCAKRTEGLDQPVAITDQIFGSSLNSLTFWTANNLSDVTTLTEVLTYLTKFRAVTPNEYVVAWSFRRRDGLIFIDEYAEQTKAVLLVRNTR